MSGVAGFPIGAVVFEKRPFDVTVRNFSKFTKRAFAAGGALWHRRFLKDHFRQDAAQKYKHQPRTEKYLKQKKAKAKKSLGVKRGGTVDNVYSGTLEQSIKGFAVLQAFPKRVTVRMSGPRYLSMRPYKTNHPNMGAELTTVTEAENRVVLKEIEQEFIGQVNKQTTTKRTRI